MFDKLVNGMKGIKTKAIAAGCAVLAATSAHAADLAQLDSLKTTLETVQTKTGDVMTVIGSIALAVVVGVIVVKLIKKGSRAG